MMHRHGLCLLVFFLSVWCAAPTAPGGFTSGTFSAYAQQGPASHEVLGPLQERSRAQAVVTRSDTLPRRLDTLTTGDIGGSTAIAQQSSAFVRQPVGLQRDRVASLVRDRTDAERAHLWRIAAWGTLNAAGGLALVLGTGRQERPAYWGFGAQSGLWGVVNIGIATAGLLSGGDPVSGFDAAVAAERTYHDILLFNLGLNVAYSAVGTTLVAVSYRGVDSARSLRGHGTSLIMQGAGLILLDAIAFFGSRARLAGLLDMAGSVSARALPSGVALSISF